MVIVIVLTGLLVQTSIVQNWLVDIATNKISKQLGTKVSISNVNFTLFNKANINAVYVEGKNNDTILYAGRISLNITDWFFLKQKVDLKFIGIADAVIKLNRKDSVWNYQYIVDHFSSSNASSKKANNNFQFKNVKLSNIRLIQNDEWRGELLTVEFEKLEVDLKFLNFIKNQFDIDKIFINEPYVNVQKFKGNRPSDYKFPIIEEKLELNPLKLIVKNFSINNGTLAINNDYEKPAKNFDGSHILFTKLNATFSDFHVNKDTLITVLDLNANERSGLVLNQLKANLTWTPKMMELSQFNLKTNKSHLTNYYSMRFNNFDDDFAEYATNVTMEAKFKNSYINSGDLAFFSTDLATWKKELELNGHFLGTVSDFEFQNLVAKERNNFTTISGNLSMKGLPDIDKTNIQFEKGYVKTNHQDLSAIIPSLKGIKTPNLKAMGTILFSGNFNGSIHEFTTKSIITTEIGNVNSNITMQLPKNRDATYFGELSLEKFNLKKFLNDDKLGIIEFNGKFDGYSFNVDKLKTKLVGELKTLEYNGYVYNNITTNGTFQNKYFNGELKIDDPNFSFIGNAEADLSKEQPQFNILADIRKANLQSMNFTKDPLSLTGLLDINFTGTNIDNFLGSAKFLNASISNDKSSVKFDSLNLTSNYIDSVKYLHLTSNDFSANVNGQFNILDLQNCFQSYLHIYYPSYIASPKYVSKDQNFNFNFSTRYIEPYLQLFDKNIYGFNDVSLKGKIDTRENLFAINLLMPYGRYKNFEATGTEILGTGNKTDLKLEGFLSNFKVSDSLNFPNTDLKISSHNDVSKVELKTRASSTLNEANLNAIVETSENGVKIKFNPSSFVLNDKKWFLDKEGEISLTKNLTEAKKVKFIQGFQEITLETSPDEGGNTSGLDIKFKNVVAGDLSSLFTNDFKLEGITNGAIHVDDVFGKMNAFADLKIDQFRIDGDSIGTANIKANYSSKSGLITANVASTNEGYNFLIDGIFDVKSNSTTPINTTINLKNSKIDLVQKLVGYDVFTNLSGFATGKLNVKGTPSELDLFGNVKLQKASLKVNYTQVKYFIDEANISFENDGINFGEFTIRDTLNNTGTVSGKLYEKNFKKLTFDFDLSTKKLLLINTNIIDNDLFFGNAIGKANLSFKGPEDNCKMIISCEANETSHFTILNSNNRETGDASFIVFKPIGEEMAETKKKSNFNLFVDLDLIANNKVDIDVVLDDVTGDVIKAKGNGRLKIKVGTNDNLEIRGKYNIEEGSYDFNFQSFIRKPFILKKGDNNFIEWSGSPFDAYLHINAMFEAKNISLKELIGNTQATFNNASKNFRDDVFVIANLTGKLMQPDIKFKFDFPSNSIIKNDDTFISKSLPKFTRTLLLKKLLPTLNFKLYLSN